MPRRDQRTSPTEAQPSPEGARELSAAGSAGKAGGTTLRVRPFRTDDIEAVLAIGAESPEAAVWSREGYEKLLEQNGTVALVVDALSGEVQRQAAGFLTGRVVAAEAEILNLAVARDSRRRGYATALLQAAAEAFESQGAQRIYLEVRQSNAGALAFYMKHRFERTGVRKGYYHHPDEPAVTMSKPLK
jgi:ribosomal-protein-alanine N-acetyltransferase